MADRCVAAVQIEAENLVTRADLKNALFSSRWPQKILTMLAQRFV